VTCKGIFLLSVARAKLASAAVKYHLKIGLFFYKSTPTGAIERNTKIQLIPLKSIKMDKIPEDKMPKKEEIRNAEVVMFNPNNTDNPISCLQKGEITPAFIRSQIAPEGACDCFTEEDVLEIYNQIQKVTKPDSTTVTGSQSSTAADK